jgi:hypothetical protein
VPCDNKRCPGHVAHITVGHTRAHALDGRVPTVAEGKAGRMSTVPLSSVGHATTLATAFRNQRAAVGDFWLLIGDVVSKMAAAEFQDDEASARLWIAVAPCPPPRTRLGRAGWIRRPGPNPRVLEQPTHR